MIKNITDLEKSLKLPEGSLKAAIENTEEVTIEIPALKIFTEEEHNTLLGNIKAEAKTAGIEIAVKEARTKLNLDFQGKTVDNLLEAHGKKILEDAKIEPNKKIQELTGDLEKVRNNYKELEQTYTGYVNQTKIERQRAEIESSIMAKMPKETIIESSDLMQIFKSKFEYEKGDNGSLIFKKNGEVLKNPTTLSPMGIDDIMPEFSKPYLKTPSGGGGGQDEPGGGKPGSLDAFTEEMEKKGVKPGSSEFNSEMQTRIKNKTLTI